LARRLPARDPRATHRRKVIAARRKGVGNACKCGEDRPEALITGSRPIICARCDRKQQRKKNTDGHHIAGQANDATTIAIPVNDHRAELSVAQQDWPSKTLQNAEESPLLAEAARIRGFMDTSVYLMSHFLRPGAAVLEHLDTFLERKLGKKWWKKTKLKSFEPRP
jgi:hypothetical protein